MPAALAILPALAVAALSIWWTIGAAVGAGLWPADDVSLSEAVATRNYAEAARLIGLGDDPNRRSTVRAGLLVSDRDVVVTPLEAAVWTRDPYLFRLLLDWGALVAPDALSTLRCINEHAPDAAVRAILEQLDPQPWPGCRDVALP